MSVVLAYLQTHSRFNQVDIKFKRELHHPILDGQMRARLAFDLLEAMSM